MSATRVLGLSGSLRAASGNTALLRAMMACHVDGIEMSVCEQLGALPLFNPDEELTPAPVVLEFQRQVTVADALVIASPEYAHGVTGTIKNALDWLVGLEAFAFKPIALLNTSRRAHHAYDALRETLLTMSATIVDDASLTIPLPATGDSLERLLASAEIMATVQQVLDALQRHYPARPTDSGSYS